MSAHPAHVNGPLCAARYRGRSEGYPAIRIDVTNPERLDLQSCRLADDDVLGLQVWYNAPANKYFALLHGGTASAYIVDVGGHRQVFPAKHRAGTTAGDLTDLHEVLDSIHVER